MFTQIYVIYVPMYLVNAFVLVSIRILYRNDDKYSADTVREYIFRTRNPIQHPISTVIRIQP